jgi:RHS repeat-associated protein
VLCYTYDGNKNVSEVISDEGDVSAHYEYAPFGALMKVMGECAFCNPWRFSSEFTDDSLQLVYYNYRHYDLLSGRWLSRDPIEDIAGQHSYIFESNRLIDMLDPLGLWALNLNYSWGPTSKSFLLGLWMEGDISVSGSVTLSGGCKDGVWKGSIEGLSQAEVGILFGKAFAFGFGWRKSWNVMGRAGLRFFAGVDGGVKGSFEYNTCSGRGSANMVFPAKIYGGAEGIAKLTVYKYYKWANQHGSGYKMPNVYEIGMFVRGVFSGDLRGTIKCDEKVCVISTTMVSEGTFSGGAKFFGWSVSLSRTKEFGEIKIFEDVVESPLRKLSRILR